MPWFSTLTENLKYYTLVFVRTPILNKQVQLMSPANTVVIAYTPLSLCIWSVI